MLKVVLLCRNQGCPDMACRICAENPNRRCRGNFADKYLAGDVLKATCGAPIRVEIINRTTGDSASKQEYEDALLEVLLCAITLIRLPSNAHTEVRAVLSCCRARCCFTA